MKKSIRLYPRGFLFSDQELSLKVEHYNHINIINQYHYYYDKHENVNVFQSTDQNEFLVIHGHYSYVNPNLYIEPEKFLPYLLACFKNNYEQFLNILDFIGGRYVIIIGDGENVKLFQDATGMRSVYYSLDYEIVSSHIHHINDIFPHTLDESISDIDSKTLMFDATPYINIKSMIPNMSLDFKTKNRKRFFPREKNKYEVATETERFELIEFLWKGQLEQYFNKYPNMIFSLTGGSDSRISMAMSKDYLKSLKSFTYAPIKGEAGTKFKSLALDEVIVKQILKDIPLRHKFFYFGDTDFENSTEEINTLDKNTIHSHGRWLIPFYNSAFPEENVMHLRGNLLEIGRAYFIDSTSKNTIKDIELFCIKRLKKHFSSIEETYSKMEHFINDGIKSFEYNSFLYDYHIMDLYYWEDRMGRWLTEVLNETDASFDTFIPFNMRSIIDITLSFDLKKRKSKYVFNELINRNYPILNFYGKNIEFNLYEQIKLNEEKKDKPIIVDKMSLFNNQNQLIKEIPIKENCIFIPIEGLIEGYYTESHLLFNIDMGIVNMSLFNQYTNPKGNDYIKYQVLINGDELLLEEDISKWGSENHLCIHNLKKNDQITIRVISLKTVQAKSWEIASKVKILSYNESPMKTKSNDRIISTSPYSKLHNYKALKLV